jgi:hypothetical protein
MVYRFSTKEFNIVMNVRDSRETLDYKNIVDSFTGTAPFGRSFPNAMGLLQESKTIVDGLNIFYSHNQMGPMVHYVPSTSGIIKEICNTNVVVLL